MTDIAAIITAIGGLIGIIFGFFQYSHNKYTDLRIKMIEKEEEGKSKIKAMASSNVYEEIWGLLYYLGAARVYIVQPYPLDRTNYVSVEYEAKRKGITGMKEAIQKIPVTKMPGFIKCLAKTQYMYIQNISEQIEDKRAQALLASNGCVTAIIKRLTDGEHEWSGSIFCEFTDEIEISEEEAHILLKKAATNIQYNLPELRDIPNEIPNN